MRGPHLQGVARAARAPVAAFAKGGRRAAGSRGRATRRMADALGLPWYAYVGLGLLLLYVRRALLQSSAQWTRTKLYKQPPLSAMREVAEQAKRGGVQALAQSKPFREHVWEKWPVLLPKMAGMPTFTKDDAVATLKEGSGVFALCPRGGAFDGYEAKSATAAPQQRALDAYLDTLPDATTISVTAAGLRCAPAAEACAAATAAFALPVNANLYITSARQRTAVPAHSDVEDQLVVQCVGSKRWRLYEPLPMFTHPCTGKSMMLGKNTGGSSTPVRRGITSAEPVLDVTLEAGDVLYVPRGFVHDTSTDTTVDEGEPSVGLTLSILTDTAQLTLSGALTYAVLVALKRSRSSDKAFDAAVRAVDRYVRATPSVRRAIPATASPSATARVVARHCAQVARRASDIAALRAVTMSDCEAAARAIDASREKLVGHLARAYAQVKRGPPKPEVSAVQTALDNHMRELFGDLT